MAESLLTFGFSKGINEYKDETLLNIDEANSAQNVDISNGVLSTMDSIFNNYASSNRMAKFSSGETSTLMSIGSNSDYLNYQQNDDEIMLVGDGINPVRVYTSTSSYRNMLNRRIVAEKVLVKPNSVRVWGGGGGYTNLLAADVGGGTKENSVKVAISPENVQNSIYYKRSSSTTSYSTRSDSAKVPYDALPYLSESDILDTYVGEIITFFERGTWDGGTSYSSPIIVNYVQVTVTNNMISYYNSVSNTYYDYQSDGVTKFVPKGNLLELNHERVWLSGDSDNPNRVYFSKDFDIDDWTIPTDEGEANMHGGLIDFPTWDGGKIIGMKVLFGDMFIFKSRHIFRVFGTYPGNYQSEQVCTMTGSISDRSIIASPNAVYFASENGIYSFGGTTPTLISQRIKKTWENLNQNYLKNAVGIFFDNKYFLAVPEGSSTINNLIIQYDINNDTFMFIRGFTVIDFIEYNRQIYFTGTSGSVEANWFTGKNNFGQSNAIKTTQKLYFLASGDGSVEFSIENEKGKLKSITVPLTSDEKLYRKRLKNKGRTLKFSISNVSGSDFKIKDMQITYEEDVD